MMKSLEFWKIFEKTGEIRDYLNYTACTSEGEQMEQPIKNNYIAAFEGERETQDDRFY